MVSFLKIVPCEFDNVSRDERELSVVKELGHRVMVIAKGESNKNITIDGFEIHCRTTRPLRCSNWLVPINRFASIITWAVYARKLKPNCISCHDIIALFIGWLSTWFTPKNKRPLLVYDAHEFEIGRNIKRSKIKTWLILKVEKFLIGKSVFTIMVNDSIADEVQNLYNLKTRPVVVRNVTNYWNIDTEKCKDKRKELCAMLKIPDTTYLIMYHGAVMINRGVENLICAAGRIDNTAVIVLGFGQNGYIEELKTLSDNAGIGHKVLFHDAVPIKELWQYVGAVDVGAITIPNTCKSYYYSLPNKLFENIQAETPLISSNFPEYKRIIEGYNVGLCCDPHNVDEIVETIEKLRNDKVLYAKMKENLKIAKKELCWENEKKILIKEYSRVFE